MIRNLFTAFGFPHCGNGTYTCTQKQQQ